MEKRIRAIGIALLALSGAVVASAQDWADISPAELTGHTTTWGALLRDYDADGDPDVFCGVYPGGSNLLLRNDGDPDLDGTLDFVDVAAGTAIESVPGAGHHWMDVDDDGDLDLLSNNSGAGRRLLRNDGDTFADITPAAFNVTGQSGGIAFADFDTDGDLDLFMTVESGSGNNQLYRNDGSSGGAVVYANVTPVPLRMTTDLSEGAAWSDFDNDGDQDLFVCAFSSANRMFRNDGGTFTDVTASIGPAASVTPNVAPSWGDYDDDGDPDLYVTGWSGNQNSLYRNDGDLDANGVPDFADVSAGGAAVAVGSHLSVVWLDFDLDGDLDLFCPATGGAAFLLRNDGDPDTDGVPDFTDVTAPPLDSATGAWGTAAADIDNDGDPDILAGRQSGGDLLFRNDQATGNHWLHVVLEGAVTGTQGVGARVNLTANGITRYREVSGSATYASAGDSRVEFGLGSATSASMIEVLWSSGQTSVVTDVPADQVVRIGEPGFGPNTAAYTPDQAFTFQVPLGGAPATEMTLFFRVGGQGAAFQSAAMFPSGGGQFYEVGVGQGFASPDGLEGYIEYRMNGGSLQTYPFPGAAGFLPAALPNQAMPQVPAGSQYVMYGLPFVPTNPSPVAVLEDDLGGYDRKRWRSFHFDPLAGSNGTYQEHPGTDPFVPGHGYWLIMAAPVAIGSAGFSTNTVNGMTLDIQRGWNQLAHPYRFPVALANVDFTAAPDVEQEIHAWDGTQYATDTQLDAWDGFFIFNAAAVAQPIGIPGVTSTAAPSPAPPAESLGGGWRLSFDVRQGGTRDRGNELGTADGATDEPDRLDRHAPPAPPGAVRAYFEQVAGDGVPHELNRDLRGSREGTWDLVVEAPEEVGARIEVDGVPDLPAELEAVLIPLDTWATIDLRGTSFVDVPGGRTHRFRVVVGSNAYVETVRSGQDSAPLELALGLGYPNPLVSSTKIGFALPSESSVRLAVYDVTGRKVRTLVDGTRAAGRYVAEWNAQDESGRAVAPGVYFVKMLAGPREETRKLTVLR